jgi:hypothetical protein
VYIDYMSGSAFDTMKKLTMTLLIMAILLTLSMGDIT